MLMNLPLPLDGDFDARLEKALGFLRRADLAELEAGSVLPIDGEDVFAQVQAYETQSADNLRYETHDVYYDVHCIVQGEEYMGCLPRELLRPETEYDTQNDITFYQRPTCDGRVLLRAGDWIALSPAEAHKPRCAAGKPAWVKKIVVKVRA